MPITGRKKKIKVITEKGFRNYCFISHKKIVVCFLTKEERGKQKRKETSSKVSFS